MSSPDKHDEQPHTLTAPRYHGAHAAKSWTAATVLLAIASTVVTVLALLAGLSAIPSVFGRRAAGYGPRVEMLEKMLDQFKASWQSLHPSNTLRFIMFIVIMLIILFAVSRTLDAAERFLPEAFSIFSLLLAVAVLGSFAIRLRIILFSHAGRLDWMMNGFAVGAGIACALMMQYRRHWR